MMVRSVRNSLLMAAASFVLMAFADIVTAADTVPFDAQRVAALQPKCEAGEAGACLEIAQMLDGDATPHRDQLLPVLIQGCGLARGDESDEAISMCLRAGDYLYYTDKGKALFYYHHACVSGFSKGCAHEKSLSHEIAWQSVLDQEQKAFEAKSQREAAEADRQMFAGAMQALVQGLANDPIQNTINRSLQATRRQNPSGAQVAAICQPRCSRQHTACQNGSPSGCYREAACECQCFIDNAPSDPSVGQWRQCVQENTANANSLNSNVPTFRPGGRTQ